MQNSAYTEIGSDSGSDNYSNENTIPIQIVGKRRYIQETLFDNVEKKNCEHVPEDIDNNCVYIVPLKKGTLNYCEGKRPWEIPNQVKPKVFQLAQDFCSIAGEATVVKIQYIRIS